MTRPFDEAVERARGHLLRALLEGLEAALALLEAASLTGGSQPTGNGGDSIVASTVRTLDRALRELRDAGRMALPPDVLEPVERALETEIARWEHRSRVDPDARPVLRTFLGLRELLFEIQRPPKSMHAPAPPTDPPATGRPRVQRFDVEG